MSVDIDDLKRRMEGALESLNKDFQGLSTGRANPSLLENIKVDVYGSQMPLNQTANVGAPEPRTLSVSVWDANNVSAVEKAIINSGLGLNPNTEGSVIRLNIPELTEDRRKELTKVASSGAENARIAVRNVRRDGMDAIKKDDGLGEDIARDQSDQVQKLTDEFVGKIDSELEAKNTDIMTV